MNTKILDKVGENRLKTDLPNFGIGDTLRLGLKVSDTKEGERIQYFEGVLIRNSGSGLGKSITVRKIGANSIGVERIIPLHSPVLSSVSVVKEGKVRRSRLYYLRNRIGKAAMAIKEANPKVAPKKKAVASKAKAKKK